MNATGKPMKILLVDDSKLLRIANERILTRAGHQVTTAEDGESALEMVRQGMPDLILLDMLLPRLSGLDVLKQLKADAATAAIPVIVLSSLSQKNEEKLKEAGAAAYFEKEALHLDKGSGALLEIVKRTAQVNQG